MPWLDRGMAVLLGDRSRGGDDLATLGSQTPSAHRLWAYLMEVWGLARVESSSLKSGRRRDRPPNNNSRTSDTMPLPTSTEFPLPLRQPGWHQEVVVDVSLQQVAFRGFANPVDPTP